MRDPAEDLRPLKVDTSPHPVECTPRPSGKDRGGRQTGWKLESQVLGVGTTDSGPDFAGQKDPIAFSSVCMKELGDGGLHFWHSFSGGCLGQCPASSSSAFIISVSWWQMEGRDGEPFSPVSGKAREVLESFPGVFFSPFL